MSSVVNPKYLLGALFTASLVMANVLAAKIVSVPLPVVGSAAVPAGFIGIAVAFLLSDTMAELYGENYTRQVVNGSIAAIALSLVLIYVAVMMPSAPFYKNEQAFRTVLMSSLPISVASVVTLLVSQNLDVYVFGLLKQITGEKHRWVRNNASTILSQLVDTTLFITLGFVVLPPVFGHSAVPLAVAWSLIVSQYAVKVGVALIDTPVFYLITGTVDRLGR